MGSSQRTRLLVFAYFFVALIIFAIFYRPVDAMSRPADPPNVITMPVGKLQEITAPLGLPPVPIPPDNPPTAETIALGRRLYYDPILSADNSVSCATCHAPQFGFADPKPVSEGVGKKTGTRNSPPVVNVAYFKVQFWDGRASS